MKKQTRVMMVAAAIVALACWVPLLQGGEIDIKTVFPAMDGWSAKGEPDVYTPDNLFEYINGAADVFLHYNFRRLGSLTYRNGGKGSVTADVYRHDSAVNGFGIYAQEKPTNGDFLAIGTQGYYEQGVLNFFKDRYYVKLSGFDLGDTDRDVLTRLAGALAQKLDGGTKFPAILDCFPAGDKIPHSERYISQGFMGHSFLHSAFTADYKTGDAELKVFIMRTPDPAGSAEIMDGYLGFVKKKGGNVERNGQFYRFQDPYYRSGGMMHMQVEKNLVWGLLSKNSDQARLLIKEVKENLQKKGLI